MRRTKYQYLAVGLLCLLLPVASAEAAGNEQTINPLPSTNSSFFTNLNNFLKREDANRFAQMFDDFTYSGGTHSTGAGLTGTPDALVAYPGGYYTTETGAITYPDNSTCWVIAHKDLTGNLDSYSRVPGTHYLTSCGSVTQPALPANTLSLMKVLTSGGSITTVLDRRRRHPIAHSVDVKDDGMGASGDGIDDDRPAFVLADASTDGIITCSDGTFLIGSNLTITSPLLFNGCILKPASGVTINLSGGVIAPETQQIFDTTASSTSYVVIQTQTVSPAWWGVSFAGAIDSLAPLNQVVKHLNAGKLNHVEFPPGDVQFSGEPNTVLEGTWTINGPGGSDATVLRMQAGAGTAGTFFRLGDATNSVGRCDIHGFSFVYDNFASLDGTKNVFDLANTADCSIHDIIAGRNGGDGVGGFIKLGDNALGTTASRTFIENISTLMYGPAEGTTFDIQRANGTRVNTSTTTVGAASVTGALRGIWMHPTGGTTTIDSGSWNNAVEFNFPGDNVKHIVDIDASQGIIINQWFNPGFVADHSIQAAIYLHIDAGADASARMNNLNFTGIRSYIDGDGAFLIDNTGQRDIGNLSILGGVLTGETLPAVRTIGTTDQIDLSVMGVNLTDTEHITDKAAIDAQGLRSLRVVGNSADAQLTSQTPNWTYLVRFTGDVSNFIIDGNDCKFCKFGVIDSPLLGLNNPTKRIVANNTGPSQEYIQRITTTGATTTTLFNITLLDARVCNIDVEVAGVKSDGTDRASYELEGTFYRTAAGSAVQVGTTSYPHFAESNAAWNATFALTGSTVQARVTGVAATDIDWGGNIKSFRCVVE